MMIHLSVVAYGERRPLDNYFLLCACPFRKLEGRWRLRAVGHLTILYSPKGQSQRQNIVHPLVPPHSNILGFLSFSLSNP